MKALDVADVIDRLEDLIEEWGTQAKGGDVFDSNELIYEARRKGDLWAPNEINLIGFDSNQRLPVCFVGTLAADLGSEKFAVWDLRRNNLITEDAELFLDHLVCAVDGVAFEGCDAKTVEYPKNPTRDWRKALDRVLKAWELA